MQFFSNFPLPLTREAILNEGLKTFEQSKTDQQWLKNWLDKKKKVSNGPILLSNYRQKLIEHAHLLQQYEDALKTSNREILIQLKVQIEQGNSFLYDDKNIKTIQKQIYQRKLKRARLHRQKEVKRIDTKEDLPIQTNEKSSKDKTEEIHSLLQLISQLKQLKTTRQQSEIDTNDELIELEKLCTEKLVEYKETSSSSQIELYNYLFNNQNQSFYQSTNSDTQYYLRAHQSINDLIQIRQGWDQYSSTHSTSSNHHLLPFQWHEPQSPSDVNWSQFIFNKK